VRRQAKAKNRRKSKANKADILLFIGVLVLAEIILDAIAGDYIKQLISEHVGTIPAALGLLALILAVWVRVEKWESLFRR